jgi:phosphoglycerate dehydrogenase-like enzyme
MNVVYHAAAGPDLAARLASLPGLDIAICPEGDDRRLASLLPDCEVLWHVLQRCTAEMIAAAPKLRLIQKIGVGVNTIDLVAASARGIPVCNLPGMNSRAVAELALALMLAVLRRVTRFDASLRAGVWSDLALQDGLGELGGRVVGLVGYGSVPRILAPILVAMGCEVQYTARHEVLGAVATWVSLETLLEQSDVISLHLPLTVETDRLIDRAAIGRMKKGCILINTARGGLVDEPALIDALRSGQLGGAGLDVFTEEPPAHDAALLAMDNVVATPHIAWITTGTFDRSFVLAAENCRRIMAGTPLLHRVDN